MSTKKEIKVVELFAGVGGFHLGLKAASVKRPVQYKVVWFNQWEPATKEQHAWKVYVREFHWEKELKYKNTNTDIGQVDVSDMPDFDLLAGGFPCQDYSVARPLNQADGIVGKKGVLWWQRDEENLSQNLRLYHTRFSPSATSGSALVLVHASSFEKGNN